jgi:ArsR family transcriptional regulator, arsenate/arsenite/antimonite-responsive transcriptional repressor
MKSRLPTEADVLSALAALAQAHRLRAFRALVVAGETGMNAGSLAQEVGVAPSALSFHLKELNHAGLISSESQGRYVVYRARFDRLNGLLAYLSEHCCQDQSCEVTAAATCTGC